jgi:hypothetical protein
MYDFNVHNQSDNFGTGVQQGCRWDGKHIESSEHEGRNSLSRNEALEIRLGAKNRMLTCVDRAMSELRVNLKYSAEACDLV